MEFDNESFLNESLNRSFGPIHPNLLANQLNRNKVCLPVHLKLNILKLIIFIVIDQATMVSTEIDQNTNLNPDIVSESTKDKEEKENNKIVPSKLFYNGYDYTISTQNLNSKGSYVGYYRCSMRRSQSCEGKLTYTFNPSTNSKKIEVTKTHIPNCASCHIKVWIHLFPITI